MHSKLFKQIGYGKIAIIALCIILGVVTDCSRKDQATTKEEPGSENAKTMKTLKIGLIPEHNIFRQQERYKPLGRYLATHTGMNIELKILSRYGNIIDNFLSAGLDGAFFGSFTFALAHSKIGVEALARPESLEGTSTYYGMIFVRNDSKIKTGKDMKGKRFAFVDKATTAGYLLPLEYFEDQGIDDYRTYFNETYFTGSHEDAIYDVLNKQADIGAAKNTVFYRLAKTDPRILSELNILVKSPSVPENGIAVRSNLDVSIKEKLKEILLTMHKDPEGMKILREFGATRFIVTTQEDYRAVFQYAEHVGLNLATYDYIND
jgi:phosphonate transport system substrate-binding protein